MAKRYKGKQKKSKKNIIILVLVLALVCGIIYIIKNNICNQKEIVTNNEQSKEEKEIIEFVEENKTLTANLLDPIELNNEIKTNLNNIAEDGNIIKIHYKLQELDEGNIDVYYKINSSEIVKLTIDIKSKTVVNIETENDELLLSKGEITNNLDENIEEDFTKLDKEENKIVNIIITDTEIVINTSFKD